LTVKIRPYGMLKEYIGGALEVNVPAGSSVRQTIAELGMPPEVVALVTVDDLPQDKDYVLQDGEVVKLLAVIGGG
jgi:sulfur carrier protein ThiS